MKGAQILTLKHQQTFRCGPFRAVLGGFLSLFLLCGGVAAAPGDHGNSPEQLRRLIDQQVGGIEKLV